jgi:hypothetical protein
VFSMCMSRCYKQDESVELVELRMSESVSEITDGAQVL